MNGAVTWNTHVCNTCLQHVDVQIMERDKDGEPTDDKKVVTPILRGQSLGQQYMVDQFVKQIFLDLIT